MKDTNFTEKHDRYPASFSFTDLCSKFCKEHLNVSPLDIRTGRAGVDQFECALVSALHGRWYR